MKSAANFVKELEYFHFREISFHRNDSEDKVANYCAAAWVHFKYTNYRDKDKEIFRNARNMTSMRRRFKQNINTVHGKGKYVEKLKKQEEEAARKREEEALKLLEEAEEWLAQEEAVKKKV